MLIFGNVTSKIKRLVFANLYLAKLIEKSNNNKPAVLLRWGFAVKPVVLTAF
jgi:hypothetical protein